MYSEEEIATLTRSLRLYLMDAGEALQHLEDQYDFRYGARVFSEEEAKELQSSGRDLHERAEKFCKDFRTYMNLPGDEKRSIQHAIIDRLPPETKVHKLAVGLLRNMNPAVMVEWLMKASFCNAAVAGGTYNEAHSHSEYGAVKAALDLHEKAGGFFELTPLKTPGVFRIQSLDRIPDPDPFLNTCIVVSLKAIGKQVTNTNRSIYFQMPVNDPILLEGLTALSTRSSLYTARKATYYGGPN